MAASFELPGLSLPDSPLWREATPTTMRSGDGTEVLDLAMGFGTALLGHGIVPRAAATMWLGQETVAAPGLGDLYSHELRWAATGALCEWAAPQWAGVDGPADLRSVVFHTGSEAVETALKTALLATGRARIHAFEGGYHGTFGLALAATHRAAFREPFAAQFGGTVSFSPYGEVPTLGEDVACVLVEPVQGRAGVVAPPEGFLRELRAECDRVGALLVLDDVLVGCGRIGPPTLPGADAAPDIVCLGKALGGGVPASAVVARAGVGDRAWGSVEGEAIHTSTLVGDPFASAAVLITLGASLDGPLESRGEHWSLVLRGAADANDLELRGSGLLWALDTGRPNGGFELSQRLLQGAVLVVPSGHDGSSITLYPSLAHTDEDAARLAAALTVCR